MQVIQNEFVVLLAVFSVYLAAMSSEEPYFLQADIKKLKEENNEP